MCVCVWGGGGAGAALLRAHMAGAQDYVMDVVNNRTALTAVLTVRSAAFSRAPAQWLIHCARAQELPGVVAPAPADKGARGRTRVRGGAAKKAGKGAPTKGKARAKRAASEAAEQEEL